MSDKKSALVQATEALDEELTRVEQLCESASRVPLSTRRNLEKAARTTTEAAQVQLLVGDRIKALMEALTAVRLRNEATVQSMQTLSDEIQRRSLELGALLERFERIGHDAREVSELVQTVSAGGQSEETSGRLKELETRMGGIADAARTLWDEAEKSGWSDLSRDAEALRQQVLAAKNRLNLLAQRISATLSN